MKNNNTEFEKIKLIVDNLNQEINSYTPWVSRKEIAGWSAIAVFIGVMFSVIKYVLIDDINRFPKYFEVLWIYVIFSIIIIIFSIITLLFIHSQYSSIYDKKIYTSAIQTIIFKLIGTKTDDLPSKGRNENVRRMIDDEYNALKKKRIRGENHVKRILINFWIYRLFTKIKARKLSTHETQEALLYSTIIFFDLVFALCIIFSFFSKISG